MLGWSLKLFRVRGIQLAVHVSFFLLLGVNAYVGWAEAGREGLFWSTLLLLAFFTCVVLHEFGHCFTAMHYGIGVRRILLMPIGGMAEFNEIPREPRREFLITLAGPAVNFVLAALLWLIVPAATTGPETAVMTWPEFGQELMVWNLAMGCFNFLPAFPMDGGRILRASLATRMSYLRATFWAATTGKVICAIGATTAVFFNSPLLAVLFGFIFIVGEMEYRAVKQREREDADWRAVLVRHGYQEPSPEEPPLLQR
jgi:Zn-dependent protease